MAIDTPDLRRTERGELRPEGRWVVYWMTSARRARCNHALDRALDLARELERPLVVLEDLRCDMPWASPRLHRFVMDGMADNARAFAGTGVLHHPYVEPTPGAGAGLLRRLATDACAVVADESPAVFLPRRLGAEGLVPSLRFETIDSIGLLPLRAADRAFSRAFDFRRFLQRTLPDHLGRRARREPLRRPGVRPLARLPADVTQRWPATPLEGGAPDPAGLHLDPHVGTVARRGGSRAGGAALRRFVRDGLGDYVSRRSHPDDEGTSGLSPYLHFGHVAAEDAFEAVAAEEDWSADKLGTRPTGAREGWWGMSPGAEAFLDQLVTWRELGQTFCFHRPDHMRYASLPDWAAKTLAEHASDPRPHLYSREQLEAGDTHDPLWNAAQRQLRESGVMHNALRMLWGKKVLQWSRSPEGAWETLFALNDRWALDGSDPNSSSGIAWTFGRFDRPWGPERPVFGKVRYMTSASARRKLRLDRWLERWGDAAAPARPC